MPGKPQEHLSRRERQIMDIIYALGRASVAQVHGAMHDRPSYSAVRALMRILEEKGHLRHVSEGSRYVYLPVRSRDQASRSALHGLLRTFFGGSAERAMAALLEDSATRPNESELHRLAQLIDKARKEGR